MSVHPGTFVVGGDIGQAVGCLDAEFLEDFHSIYS
jgi:hypothetical protein